MAVVNPIKLVITNYPADQEEMLTAINNPEDESQGSRAIPFSRELYIEREDFKEEANRKFFRLTLGKEVRLKNAYIIKGESVTKDDQGNITEIQCSYDPDSKSGSGSEASMRKVKGTIHWVSVSHALQATVHNYDRLFNDESPDQHKEASFLHFVNPSSLHTQQAMVEPSLNSLPVGERVQFQRLGYYVVDSSSRENELVFNKTVGLRDTWSKKQ
jgi:glutaminyl-tRNA synthetase